MRKFSRIAFLLAVCLLSHTLWADSIDVYFGPLGGFHPDNNRRTVMFPDSRGEVQATLAQSLINMLARIEAGGQLKVAMYSMNDMTSLEEMITAARERGVTVKLIMDAAADWTADTRKKILDRLQKAREEARTAGKPFDFQVKVVTAASMKERGRSKVLSNGLTIVGTMHEKFGLIYAKGNPVPSDCFCGSANISITSDQIYGENRVLFRGHPAVARQFQEEFARLWNEYGTGVFGPCTSESFIPVDPVAGEVEVVFNAEPIDETCLNRIDDRVRRMIREVGPKGSLDLAMFSLTNRDLASEILETAQRNPFAKFRLLFDQSQVDDSNPESGILAPWMFREAKARGLKNLQIRFKWRSNAYGPDPETGILGYLSLKGLFLHHKVVVVNRGKMGIGSYNWSGGGEASNFENLMIFDGTFPDQAPVIDCFLKEFEAVWTSTLRPSSDGPAWKIPQSISPEEAFGRSKSIVKLLRDPVNLRVMQALDWNAALTLDALAKKAAVSEKELSRRVPDLLKAGLLCRFQKDGKDIFAQAD